MIAYEEIKKNESYWRNMTEEELNVYVDMIFSYYKQTGFPYYNLSQKEKEKEFQKLEDFDCSTIIQGDLVRQTMHGLGLAWSYFPHAWGIKCGKLKTPMEVFEDDETFKKVIRKRLKIGTYISDSGIRKILKTYSGVQAVSNFRPTAAKAIYDTYAPEGVVYDMSCGFGGRLLGALTSTVSSYIGVDPSEKTFEGLQRMRTELNTKGKKIHLFKTGSEEFIPPSNTIDLCFTSPPYFDHEKYAVEDSQSYKKFTTSLEWLNNFLRVTLQNCHQGLKESGHLILNVANTKSYPTLEEDTIRVAEDGGFSLIGTQKLLLSNLNKRSKSGTYKYEPMFVFKKK
jgi:SAM-dependent methyltransferase